MQDFAALPAFATSFGLGLLMGLERERRSGAQAGLRTFALASTLGTAAALLSEQMQATWLLPVVLLALALTMIGAGLSRGAQGGEADTTTTVALLLSAMYGAMLWHGYTLLTVALALGTTTLLYFKTELHDVSRRMSRQDMVSILQFGAITFVVLPILPDVGYGPYGAVNPHDVWLMVVLVAGISLAGYVALRIAGPNRAPVILGLLGGLVSSTATTLAFSRRARQREDEIPQALAVILTANLVLLARLAVMCAIVAPGVLTYVLPVLGLGLVAGAAASAGPWRNTLSARVEEGLPIGNPMELLPALGFGLVYALALIVTSWLNESAGHVGVYVAAPILGLTDMDAITLSTLNLHEAGKLDPFQVTVTLVLAICANVVFKAGIASVLGGARLARGIAAGFGAVLAGLALGVAAVYGVAVAAQ